MAERTCGGCGTPILRRAKGKGGQRSKWCSKRCADNARYEKKQWPERTCLVCRRIFTPNTWNQRFCAPTDAERSRTKPGNPVPSSCNRAYSSAKIRGTLDQLLSKPRLPPVVAPFDCAHCGKHCIPGQNVVPHAKRFCCEAHKKAWHAETLSRRQHAERALAKAARGSRGSRTFYCHCCPECGVGFISTRTPTDAGRYCSALHQKRQKARRRRAVMAGAGYKTLRFHAVADRDNWHCQLCGKPVDQALRTPAPMAPTLDHIIPLAYGGTHSEDNAQLAHFICNSRKGDGVSGVGIGGQTALV